MVTAPVPGRAHQGQGRGPVDQVLQHLLAGDRQSSSLGGRSVSVSVRVAEDGGQEAGAQSREILRVCHGHQQVIARRGGSVSGGRTCSGGRTIVRRGPRGWSVEGSSRGGNTVTDTAQAGTEAEDQPGGRTGLPVSGGPWGGEAVSGVGDVDGGSRHGSPTDVERRP